MEISQSNKKTLNFLIPFLTAYLCSKAIFYSFSFEYSLFSDAFEIKNLLINFCIFGVLYYIGTIAAKYFINTKG